MSETVHVVATLEAAPGKAAQLKRLLEGLIEPTRREAGCITYRLLEGLDRPDQFTFVEEWESAAALEAHAASAHLQQARGRYPELLAGAVDLRRCALVG